MALPEFITFTGVDAWTSPTGMAELAAEYPIEWGVLFSPRHQGEGRYPSLLVIEAIVGLQPNLRYAAHLCGADARAVMERGESQHDDLIHRHFTRVQINTTQHVTPAGLADWGNALSVGVIAQCRGPFPADPLVEWLFDQSGGRGVVPSLWPQPTSARCGYAGGLRSTNVKATVRVMAAGSPSARFWIDMETGVRDANDRFDLAECRRVCEAVYG